MAKSETIKTTIDANINTNGNQAITGAVMNSVLKQMVDSTDAQFTELSEELIPLKGELFGEIYNGGAKEGQFELTSELKEGDELVISVDKLYSAGAISFLDNNGAQIHVILFSTSTSAQYTIPSNYAKCELIWGAEWQNLVIVKKNTIRQEVSKKMEGEAIGVGVNLHNSKIELDGYISFSQSIGANPVYDATLPSYGHCELIPVYPNLSYHIKAEEPCAGFYKLFLDKDKKVASLSDANGVEFTDASNDVTLVAPSNAAYLVITTRFGGKYCKNLQVELGEKATAYEAYREAFSLPVENLPTYVQEATKAALEDKPRVAKLESLLMEDGDLMVYASVGDSLTEGLGVAVGTIETNDTFFPRSGTSQKTYAYMIAKRNKMAWRNYGISGSTMGNIVFNGQSYDPFSVGRYMNMADDIDVISIWFGVNDSYYGKLAKAEEWLSKTYGKKIYYPLDSSQQGTTASDGTPYATNEQYVACVTAEEEFNGVKYKGFALYEKQYEGLPTDTDDSTWWGAWNKVLSYLIEKYPFAKILVITGYGNESYLYDSAKAIAEKYGVLHLDLREYGVTWLEGGDSFVIDYDATDFADRTYFKAYSSEKVSVNEFRKRTMLYDGLHFNKFGYEYITPFIENALNL